MTNEQLRICPHPPLNFAPPMNPKPPHRKPPVTDLCLCAPNAGPDMEPPHFKRQVVAAYHQVADEHNCEALLMTLDGPDLARATDMLGDESILCVQPYTLHRTLCTIHRILCTVPCAPYTVRCAPYTIRSVPCTIHPTIHSAP